MKELDEMVTSIRDELNSLYEAQPTEEKIETAEENGEAYDLYSYFNDVLDIEYTLNSQKELIGVRLYVTLGGPTVWVDTRNGEVAGAWGTDRANAWLASEICEEINTMFEDALNA